MEKNSLKELKRFVTELNAIKAAYEVDFKHAVQAIEWIKSMKSEPLYSR